MAGEDDVPDETSLRRRATRRLLDLGARALTRARLGAEGPGEVAADLLLMESQHSVYVQLHRRWTERAQRGDGGLRSALEALDAMWDTVRQLRAAAPTVLSTLSNPQPTVTDRRARFYVESTQLLEDAIRHVFATDLGQLALPPERLAVLVRVTIGRSPGGSEHVLAGRNRRAAQRGKSTLFNALTAAGAEAANYPFCTIEPNVGIVRCPTRG
jgi:hypothetical protein